MKISAFRHHRPFDMLRSCVKMGEKERNDEKSSNGDSVIEMAESSNLVQCVERFFKNPQQNYEVPLQLLQEWFSDTPPSRREELAKLFLAILQEQGLDMEQILGPSSVCIENTKINTVYIEENGTEVEEEYVEIDPNSLEAADEIIEENVEMRDVSCGEELVQTQEEPIPEVRAPTILRQYKRHNNVFLHTPTTKPKIVRVEEPQNIEVVSTINEEVIAEVNGFSSEETAREYTNQTRSVGTSPYQEKPLHKSSSMANLALNAPEKILRKSRSLPSMRLSSVAEMPPLAPLTVKEEPKNPPAANKPTVISRATPASYKARTTFLEMSQAEFNRRQTLLNDRAGVRQGFRIGGQILYVPELVSCGAPIGEKTPPLLVHTEHKKRPVKINDAMDNVLVSQNSSSHTIHYTPTHSHSNSSPSQLMSEKCPVVYVTDSAANPVFVSGSGWQEEARKKPIIAYAKRKAPEKVVLGDGNMKVLIAQNGILNPVDVQTTKVITQCRTDSMKQPVISHAPHQREEVVFVKRVEEKRTPLVVIPSEAPTPKPTLPKFNQTFVQNLQVKTAKAAEPIADAQPIEYPRKIKKHYTVTEAGNTTVSHTPSVIHTVTTAPTPVVVERPPAKPVSSSPPQQVGLLIYTQGSPEESSAVQTLLLTTLPNGSAYCVRLPAHANLQNAQQAVSPQVEIPQRPVVVQTLPHCTPVVKAVLKKPESIPPTPPPAESNKVALLQDLKEFENVFEETKLKFEKEKQLNVGELADPVPVAAMEASVQTTPSTPQPSPPVVTIPKFDCEKVVVGVKRKPEDMPVVTRLFTTAKKPLIVVANYGQGTTTQVPTRPVVCSTSPPVVAQLKSPKPKSRPGKTFPSPAKSPPSGKPQQKPQEDEKTQQKIFAILEEYAVQKEHSPDTNNRPAPRRRSNPPSGNTSKKKRPLLKTKESGESDEGSFSEM